MPPFRSPTPSFLAPGHLFPATSHPFQVLLNVLADEIHRAHQKCVLDQQCDPNKARQNEYEPRERKRDPRAMRVWVLAAAAGSSQGALDS
jgi:hypothetical protein